MYSVAFSRKLEGLPAEVRTRVRRSLEEIGRTIEALPSGGVLLASLAQSPMQIDVSGWRFVFKVEPDGRRMVAVSATPAPPAPEARDKAGRK